MDEEPTYADIEAYRRAPAPRDASELADQAFELNRLATHFPEYFPERISDEELLQIMERGRARRMMERTLNE